LVSAHFSVPVIVVAAGERAGMRFLEFFTAYTAAPTPAGLMPAPPMNSWPGTRLPACRRSGAVQPVHVAMCNRDRDARARRAEREATARRDPPAVRLVGDRQVVPVNPAVSVRRPLHVVTSGQTPVLILRKRARCSTASTMAVCRSPRPTEPTSSLSWRTVTALCSS